MSGSKGRMRTRVLTLAVAAVGVVAIAGTALAGHQTSGVKSYTGCLVSGDGVIIKIKEGNAPRAACTGGQVEAHFSGGDITKISVGNGLSLPNGGDNGEVRIELAAGQALPQGCDTFEFPIKRSSGWVCADHEVGPGLVLGKSVPASGPVAVEYEIASNHLVKNDPDCASGQFATGFDGDGDIQCAAPASATSAGAFSRLAGVEQIAGTETVLSKNLPAGNYLLFAHVVGDTPSIDEGATGHCDLAGDTAALRLSDDPLERWNDNLTLLAGIVHPGGTVALTCTETSGNFDVSSASLAAIKLDSIG